MTNTELELERLRLENDKRALDLAFLRHQHQVEQDKLENDVKLAYLELEKARLESS